MPVPVTLAHNYTSVRHLEFYIQGGEHIMLTAPLNVGRLRRDQGEPLCWTPSRARGPAALPHWDDPVDRMPTCRTRIRTAYRITGRTPGAGVPRAGGVRLRPGPGGVALVAVDELDKIESAELAQQLLNEIKGVFGVDGTRFLVSVSDDALGSRTPGRRRPRRLRQRVRPDRAFAGLS